MNVQKRWRYQGGRIIETEQTHCSHRGPGGKRSERRKPTDAEMVQINERQRIRKLERLLRANFTEEDWHLVLTYRKEDRPDPEEAKERLTLFLRKLRKEYRKAGAELKYIHVTEYLNHAIHHHLVINHIQGDTGMVRRAWEYGRPNFSPLHEDGDVRGLAEYLVKETVKTRLAPDAVRKQAYTPSRNLIKPEPQEVKTISSRTYDRPIRIHKGYMLIKDSMEEGVTKYGYPFRRWLEVRVEPPEPGGRRKE